MPSFAKQLFIICDLFSIVVYKAFPQIVHFFNSNVIIIGSRCYVYGTIL